MPMGEYKNFADCETKNKDKDNPSAYCGYIKKTIEGGKKKEEALGNRYEHEAYHLEEDIRKDEEARRPSTREKHMAQNLGYSGKEFPEIEGAPEPELERAKVEFMRTLEATVKDVTLMAKDVAWPNNPNSKVFPTTPVSVDVKQQMADVVVKQAKGFGVEVNWFNSTLSELQDIVKSANKFFEEAGWNNKETVKEYKNHQKKLGNDWM